MSRIITKPTPNFYTCRLLEPVSEAEYYYKRCAEKSKGRCIDHVYMKKRGEDSTKLQSLRYKKTIWTRQAAKAHCDQRGGRFDV